MLEAADPYHRPILATLVGAGLRVGEAVALDWSDVNLGAGTLTVGRAKTDAGTYREVDLPRGLIEALSEWKARSPRAEPGDPVFVGRARRRGRAARLRHHRQTVTNVDHRVKTAIAAANVELAKVGIEPISERVTPHSLRRTYASLRAAAGDHPVYIAEQLGHEDPGFTFRVYQRAVKRRERLNAAYLAAFDRALEWAEMGRIAVHGDTLAPGGGSLATEKWLNQAEKSPQGR